MKLWAVGKFVENVPGSLSDNMVVWEFQGVFDSEEAAIGACRNKDYFVGPCTLNQEVPDALQTWPGSYYPLLEVSP